jgi:O-methyltransferase
MLTRWRLRRRTHDSGDPLAGLPEEVRRIAQRDLRGANPRDRSIVERALPYTMTGVPRLLALIDAVRYCVRREIPGAFAECGVWLGGSVLAMLLTLEEMGSRDREVFLYDTFEGMTRPTEHDISQHDRAALETWNEARQRGDRPYPELFDPAVFSEERVREVVIGAGYPGERLNFVKGPVEATLPREAPPALALLRLDTDWYESTRHELHHLFPRLSPGGVLIIDDYGHWEGCRKAVDEYFGQHPPLLLNRIDYAGRIAVRT